MTQSEPEAFEARCPCKLYARKVEAIKKSRKTSRNTSPNPPPPPPPTRFQRNSLHRSKLPPLKALSPHPQTLTPLTLNSLNPTKPLAFEATRWPAASISSCCLSCGRSGVQFFAGGVRGLGLLRFKGLGDRFVEHLFSDLPNHRKKPRGEGGWLLSSKCPSENRR